MKYFNLNKNEIKKFIIKHNQIFYNSSTILFLLILIQNFFILDNDFLKKPPTVIGLMSNIQEATSFAT